MRSGYDVAVQIDADGQHDPRYLETLMAGWTGSTSASAAASPGPTTPTACAARAAGRCSCSRGVLSRLAGTTLTDVTSGFRVCNRRAMTVFAEHYPAEYLGDTVESLVIATRVGCKVGQLPVDMRPRAAGQASASPSRPRSSSAAPWSRWGWPWSAAGRRPSTRACRTPAPLPAVSAR